MTTHSPIPAELVGGPLCGHQMEVHESSPVIVVNGHNYYFDTLSNGVLIYTFWR